MFGARWKCGFWQPQLTIFCDQVAHRDGCCGAESGLGVGNELVMRDGGAPVEGRGVRDALVGVWQGGLHFDTFKVCHRGSGNRTDSTG